MTFSDNHIFTQYLSTEMCVSNMVSYTLNYKPPFPSQKHIFRFVLMVRENKKFHCSNVPVGYTELQKQLYKVTKAG